MSNTETSTADRLLALWQETCDELDIPTSGLSAELIKGYAFTYARYQLERVATALRTDNYVSAAHEVEARANLIADLSTEL